MEKTYVCKRLSAVFYIVLEEVLITVKKIMFAIYIQDTKCEISPSQLDQFLSTIVNVLINHNKSAADVSSGVRNRFLSAN